MSAEAAAAPRSKGLPGWLWAAAAAGAIAIAIGVAMVRRRGADDEL